LRFFARRISFLTLDSLPFPLGLLPPFFLGLEILGLEALDRTAFALFCFFLTISSPENIQLSD